MLLSEIELRAALEPLLDRLLTERLRLFRLELEPRLQGMIAAGLEPRAGSDLQAGLERLRATASPGACFSALFDLSEQWLGRQRALLVVQGGRAAVWKSAGLRLPERFSLERQEEVLRGGTQARVQVRGRTVGLLHWPGGALGRAEQQRVELLLQWAGLLLLEQALASPPAEAASATAAAREPAKVEGGAATAVAARPEAGTPAQRFAALLIEDLRLYLQRERAQELAAGRAAGDWRTRFAPELERCRRAFSERFASDGDQQALEEVTSRLGE